VRDTYHQELDRLSLHLVEMTQLVRSAMARASSALLDADLALAEEVINSDSRIDTLRNQVEQNVLELMACQQPVATDLRALLSALPMSSNLERMGDLAAHIADIARRRYPASVVPAELRGMVREMAQIAEQLAGKAGSVIASRDVTTCLELDTDDDQMDQLHTRLLATLLAPDWTHAVETTIDITLAGRYFERYADHAVHLAHHVVYLTTGQTTTHHTAAQP
jgi:phosphate transport system protein